MHISDGIYAYFGWKIWLFSAENMHIFRDGYAYPFLGI